MRCAVHAVAVQHLVHFARRQEQVVAAVVGNQEAEAVGMALHRAGDEIELGDDAKLALAVDEQLAVALQRFHARIEQMLLLAADRQARCDLGRRQRRARFGELTQDRFAGRHRRRGLVGRAFPGPGVRGAVAARRRKGIVFDKDRGCF